MWCLQKWQIKIKAQNAAERRGETPFKGGKRNSAFWAILTTLDPVAVVGPGEEKGQDAEEFIASSSMPPLLIGARHCMPKA